MTDSGTAPESDCRYVFVGGLHRSGTSLLANLLSRHPQVSGFRATGAIEDEGQFLQSVFPIDNIYGGPGRFGFDPAAHLTEDSPLVTAANQAKLAREWGRHWDAGRPVRLEKSPANLLRSRCLQALFPNSHFIFILRHPIANALATSKWSGTGIYALMHHWAVCHERMRADLPHLRHVRVVHYEHLVSQPERELEQLEHFLGLPAFPYPVRTDSTVNQRYFDQWHHKYYGSGERVRPVPTAASYYDDRVGLKRRFRRWVKRRVFGEQRQLTQAAFEALDAVASFEPDVNRFGYSLIDLDRVPPTGGAGLWGAVSKGVAS